MSNQQSPVACNRCSSMENDPRLYHMRLREASIPLICSILQTQLADMSSRLPLEQRCADGTDISTNAGESTPRARRCWALSRALRPRLLVELHDGLPRAWTLRATVRRPSLRMGREGVRR